MPPPVLGASCASSMRSLSEPYPAAAAAVDARFICLRVHTLLVLLRCCYIKIRLVSVMSAISP